MFSIGSNNEYYICRDKVIWSKLKNCKFLDKTGVFQSCLKIVNIFLLMCRGSDNLSSLINPKTQHWQLKGWLAKIQTSGDIEHPSQACFLFLILSFQMENCAVGPHSEAPLWFVVFHTETLRNLRKELAAKRQPCSGWKATPSQGTVWLVLMKRGWELDWLDPPHQFMISD